MDFLYSIHHINELWSFTKYVFSIGTYEGEYFEQLMFPLKTIEDTIIFAIDEKYHLLDFIWFILFVTIFISFLIYINCILILNYT